MSQSPFDLFKTAKPLLIATSDDLASTTYQPADSKPTQYNLKQPSQSYISGHNQGVAHCTQLLTLNDNEISMYYMRKQLVVRVEQLNKQLEPLICARKVIENEQDKMASNGFVSDSISHKLIELNEIRSAISAKVDRKNQLKYILAVEVEAIEVNQV